MHVAAKIYANGARERQPQIYTGGNTGDETQPSPLGEIQGFPVCIDAFLTRGYFLNSAKDRDFANGAWIGERERTCNA